MVYTDNMKLLIIAMILSGGFFSGGVIALAWNRLPVWKELPFAQFKSDFGRTIRFADILQPFLLAGAIISTLLFALNSQNWASTLAWMATAGYAATMAASVALLVPLQRKLLSFNEEPGDLAILRAKWITGHIGRTVLSSLSFILAAVSVAVYR